MTDATLVNKNVTNYVTAPDGSIRTDRPNGPPAQGGIESLTGVVANGNTVLISGSGFTAKPDGPKPAFWFSANDATLGDSGSAIGNPSSKGRNTTWNGRFWPDTTSVVDSLAAPGSTRSVVADFSGNEDPVAPLIDFGSSQPRNYSYRKTRDEYSAATSFVYRLFLTADPGSRAGETVTGSDSGTTATILSSGGGGNVTLRNDEGTISTGSTFNNGETVTFSGGGTGIVVAAGFDPIDSTLNRKTWRLWAGDPGGATNNVIVSVDTVTGIPAVVANTSAYYEISDPDVLNGGDWDNELDQVNGRWLTEEVAYIGGTLNNQDTTIELYRTDPDAPIPSRVLAWEPSTRQFIGITTANPDHPRVITHHQISNGAMPNTTHHMDCFYHDTSLHRVMIGNAATWDAVTEVEIQLPNNQWSDETIEFELRQGSLSSLAGNWLYVFDESGQPVNNAGFAL